MTTGEYGELEQRLGAKVTRQGGVWWRQVRPGFLRPLFPFAAFERDTCAVPWRRRWIGLQHPVPNGSSANSDLHYYVFDEVQGYSLEKLEQRYRKNTKKGLSHFDVRPVLDRCEFLSKGYPVYVSFYSRTGYGYRRDRRQRGRFEAWAGALFDCSKVVVLGAYEGNRLRGITVAYLVEDIIISPTYFAETEALRLRVSEAMLHVLRTKVARCQQARYIFMGHVGQSPTLDQYKESRGCKRLALPAFCRLNPVVRSLLRVFRKRDYERLGWRQHPGGRVCA